MISQTPRIALIAALPRELVEITRTWPRQHLTIAGREHTIAWSDAAIAIAAGMGQQNAALALHALEGITPVHTVVSLGFAGALDPELLPGDLLRPSRVIDARTGERLTLQQGDGSIAVTTTQVADAPEKQRLAATYQAQIAEMEAAGLARLCLAKGIPCLAFKAISDDADFSLPALNQFATKDGQFRTFAFAAHVALRPGLWDAARALGAGAKLAQQSLTKAVTTWLAEQR
jgi:adenosylhomocysteine nucleosidase